MGGVPGAFTTAIVWRRCSEQSDLLGEEMLAQGGDPEYTNVAACFPPISKMYVYSFVGTHECMEKVGVFYGGTTPNSTRRLHFPAIRKNRRQGRVLDGLVGGWLPALRFVYPEKPGTGRAVPLCADAGGERKPAGAAGLVSCQPDRKQRTPLGALF